ncbi:MAG: hypothetical protein RMJ84_12750, partial [Sandaracinaceae bacterium]|nr:hypothetical protein [Sandaracinaceae bacterium]
MALSKGASSEDNNRRISSLFASQELAGTDRQALYDTLGAMECAPNLHQWIWEELEPYVGKR